MIARAGAARQPRRAVAPATRDGAPLPSAAASGVGAGQTSDDVDAGWGQAEAPDEVQGARDRWLREQRPPHWE